MRAMPDYLPKMVEIAKQLSISPKTAETYRAELMKELDIHDIASLTRYALRMGVVALDA